MFSAMCLEHTLFCLNSIQWFHFAGTCVYFASFIYHQRYKGKSVGEVALFVGFANGLWFVFPLLGVWASATLINSDTWSVFR